MQNRLFNKNHFVNLFFSKNQTYFTCQIIDTDVLFIITNLRTSNSFTIPSFGGKKKIAILSKMKKP